MPYLQWAPSARVIPLKFAQDALWQGPATKFAPNGTPISPITSGFTGGGMQGGTFGAAVDAKVSAWLSSYRGKCLTVFDKNRKPLTPPEGITFNRQLCLMQGIIVHSQH